MRFVSVLAVVLVAMAAIADGSVLPRPVRAAAGAALPKQGDPKDQRTLEAELFDLRERWMHPDTRHHGVGGSEDDHGSEIRPAGPVEEQDSSHWMNKAKDTIETSLLKRKEIKGIAKNVIIFMGDGMSIPTLAATRVYLGNENQQLSFEKFSSMGLSKTYCVDSQVADSACSATAYLCGVKANIGTMGVSARVPRSNCTAQMDTTNHVDSVLAWGMASGKSAGIVTTTRITHASPGGAYAHIANRDWEDDSLKQSDTAAVDADKCKDIAKQLVEDAPGKDFKVILGGGRRGFIPKAEDPKGRRLDGVNLIKKWKESKAGTNFQYVEDKKSLLAVDPAKTDYLMGLFEWSHVQYHLDADETQPSLKEMVTAAVNVLKKEEKGFVLFVEGGRIDHGHHDSYAHYALDETKEFSEAIQAAVGLTNEEDTLIVVTSDHAHTMSMAGYAPRNNDIFKFAGKDENKEVYMTLSYANGPGYQAPDADGRRHDPTKDDTEARNYMFPATAHLNSETHGGDDVGIFARGPYAHLYTGVHEQNMIPHIAAYAAAIGPYKTRVEPEQPSSAPADGHQVAVITMLASVVVPGLSRWLL